MNAKAGVLPSAERLLEPLNDEQRAAVQAVEGPLLIVAGAGTGKTRVIAHRAGMILARRPDLSPSNLLMLTFSRKAAAEMRDRVGTLLGPHPDEPLIGTFHSVCRALLQDHPSEAGLPRGFRILSRVDQWMFLKSLLPDLGLARFLNLAKPSEAIEDFLYFIGRAKDELCPPDAVEAYARAIPDKEDRARWQEVARVYRIYEERKRRAGLVDFGDLITLTLDLLRNRPAVLGRLQARFSFLMVDEFQDTNVAQIELVSLLAARSRNVCVVGDDDQAIYRFRGASFASFLLFEEKFPDCQKLALTRNYRSTERILLAAEAVIRRNAPDRYAGQKGLWTKKGLGAPIRLVRADSFDSEASAVVDLIQERARQSGDPATALRGTAVLYRAHAHRRALQEKLTQAGIPFTFTGSLGLFEKEPVQDILAWLRVIDDPYEGVSLFRILCLPRTALGVQAALALSALARKEEIPLIDAVERSGRAKEFLATLSVLKGLARQEDARRVLEHLLERTGFWGELEKSPCAETEQGKRAASRLFQIVTEFVQEHPQKDLASFLEYIDAYIEAGGDWEASREDGEEPGARLMTVHQAKGLEFPCVFVLSLVQNRFPTRDRSAPIEFPEQLMREKLPVGLAHLQEERRLFYVAMTRAQQDLVLSTVARPHVKPSLFLSELVSGTGPQAIEEVEVPEEEKEAVSRSEPSGWKEALIEQAPSLPSAFSFSQISTYAACPLKYKFRYGYHIPPRRWPHLSFGTLMHGVLEAFYRKIQEGERPGLADLLALFEERFDPKDYADDFQAQSYRKEGHRILKDFFKKSGEELRVPLKLEAPFLLSLGSHQISGVIDRIDPLPDGTVEIIDYKTGSGKSPDEIQLSLYAIAARELFNLEPALLSYYLLTPGERISVQKSPKELEETKAKILEIVSQIASGDFHANPGFICRNCDYRPICPA